ncbi:SDR family oxidoreductase [Nocardioides sp. W3-2-3]|uniref:SDR family oxidoreductase n=1 Tax=Nocardioides convexus TaxID=2712224 RepID=UPI0024186FA0|nr:SDR family NAD(P)-dependent oxidoreductase [Nocardioides convexus]NHA00824.1 SDR family oxidoreductase [Nocardioides convexus]
MSAPRRAVVTGAGPGSIGESVARALADDGWEVVVTTRQAAVDGLEWHALDLADRGSVARFAQWYAERTDRLHLLVNSAGIHLDLGSRWSAPQARGRPRGALAHQLPRHRRPHRGAAAGPADRGDRRRRRPGAARRLPACTSAGRWRRCWGGRRRTTRGRRTAPRRLGLVHHAAWLAAEHGCHGLRAIAVHPGAVSTNIANRGLETRPVLRLLRNLARPLERRVLLSPRDSAAHLVRLGTTPEGVSGYYRKSRPAEPAPAATDEDARLALVDRTNAWLAGRT